MLFRKQLLGLPEPVPDSVVVKRSENVLGTKCVGQFTTNIMVCQELEKRVVFVNLFCERQTQRLPGVDNPCVLMIVASENSGFVNLLILDLQPRGLVFALIPNSFRGHILLKQIEEAWHESR